MIQRKTTHHCLRVVFNMVSLKRNSNDDNGGSSRRMFLKKKCVTHIHRLIGFYFKKIKEKKEDRTLSLLFK